MHTLFGFVTCPLCELRLAAAAIGLGLCFIGSSPGVCYKTLPPILFHFSLVLLILVKIEMHIIELQTDKRKDLRRKVNVSFFFPTLIFWPLLQIPPL